MATDAESKLHHPDPLSPFMSSPRLNEESNGKRGGGGGADTVCVCTIQEWCILQKFTAPYNKEGNTRLFSHAGAQQAGP